MRAPRFWERKSPSLPARLLSPAAAIYGRVAASRMRRPGRRAEIPVLCVGNFTAGGAGKTPTALAIAEILTEAGETPAFLSRGYGGRLAGPVQVRIDHTAADVGDEPLLLAGMAPTVVSRDRPRGAGLAVETGATVIVMDDGLQNPSLLKDGAIAVIDGATGIGNGLPLPAGPLRAPMEAQWPAVDAVVVIGEGEPGTALAAEAERRGKRAFRGVLEPDPAVVESLSGRPLLAFAGIGRPDKFFATLRACGLTVAQAVAFADHHAFDASDIASLKGEAERRGLQPVTTEKDLVRIEGAAALPPWPELRALPVRLRLEDPQSFRRFLLRRIAGRRTGLPPDAPSG
ncbi:tetraacyldisaccharide 4'-kinase [Microvirga thermotolerans]|uniref:Tetraacyldisaccharide 4'-kinase n=1 Tax=Microvirga thermotolerans TaxID=2651334 RepID=A0A5P9JUD6_9HYPH|nr:tetraacyldisaccharide 4'-kinase [Microvirga thermotolerans]QFU15731.1 tetraacyldisaccharide 4'-kinase [Microvirga thermotolerans]